MLGAMRILALGLVLLAPATALAGNPWEELMGPGKPIIWNDPGARFYLDLPVGWTAEPRRGEEHVVDFFKQHPDYGHTSRVTVEMRTVPPGVKPAHFAARMLEEVKKQAPRFTMLEADKIPISGVTGHRSYFTYQERGNVELTNEAVQIVFLIAERAFIITFLCPYGTRSIFWEDFEKMVKNFVGRGPGEETLTTPQKRKRVKAGEMVNPDAIPY
jgi:hypothetical protein